MSIDVNDEILQDFLVEAGEILEQLSEQLMIAAAATENGGAARCPFHAIVPRVVVVRSITVFFAVGFVVLALVGDKIGERETIVCRHEIDAA